MLDPLVRCRHRLKARALMPVLAALLAPRRAPQTALLGIHRRLGQPVRGRRPRRVARVGLKPRPQLDNLRPQLSDQDRLRSDQRLKLLIARPRPSRIRPRHACKIPCKPAESCYRPRTPGARSNDLNSYPGVTLSSRAPLARNPALSAALRMLHA